MKNIFLTLITIFFVSDLNSQANLLNAKDPSEIGKKQNEDEDKSLEYAEIDDSDILWSKVVYEYIDLNEKLNFPLLYPTIDANYGDTRKSLWKVIKDAINSGEINEVYAERNDNFLPQNKIMGQDSLGIKNYTISQAFSNTWAPGDDADEPTFVSSSQIYAYKIKGVWFFDKKHSELKYRLLGLMPVGENLKQSDGGNDTGYFWLWYPQIREILSKHKVFNDKNNNNRISFDDLLVNRRFSSFIYKYNNVYGDREIHKYIVKRDNETPYQHHLRILLESERIKKQILDFEVDMWGY